MKDTEYKYKIPPVEKAINQVISFIFYYRLVFVLLALTGIVYTGLCVYEESMPADKLRNGALIFTGGSVIIGIFYSILNYEHNQLKFRHDIKVSRETLTYNTTCRMHEAEMIRHFKTLKGFYEDHRLLFSRGVYPDIQKLFRDNTEARMALVVLFNYFEGISLGVLQGIMDESFMKEFFKSIFVEYHHLFGGFLDYVRSESKSARIFWRFSQLAEKWKQEN
jgi:hypothetical protein